MKHLILVLTLAAVALAGCQAAGVALNVAQVALAGFSLETEAAFDGELAFNSQYIAVDAKVDATIKYRAPTVAGGPPVVVWEKTLQKDAGQRAYKIVFTGRGGQDFVQILSVSWAEARTAMPFLSEPRTVEAATAEPVEASPPIAVARP